MGVSDSTDQTLIYVKVCKDKIISLKGKKNKKKSITYLDSYDVSGGKIKNLIFWYRRIITEKKKMVKCYIISQYISQKYML